MSWGGDCLYILDQTKLPLTETQIRAGTYERVAEAIRHLEVRGAPAIGVAAAYGVVLGLQAWRGPEDKLNEYMQEVLRALRETRPTAVNLFWALRRMENKLRELYGRSYEELYAALLAEAEQMAEEDEQDNCLLGAAGCPIVPEGARILTHCNAGALATVSYGTALGVVRAAAAAGKVEMVYSCETRPLLQGARLTTWELSNDNIPVTLITDSMAGFLMQQGRVDLVITGADRIAANGDTANKIGTYALAVLAKAHEIPFYIAAPTSTIDIKAANGEDITIEERDGDEVRCIGGVRVVPAEIPVYNPAFDITPGKLLSGIITEKGIITPVTGVNILKMMG
jgi:methylthioribose-1-phosphate isomerase